MNSDTKKSFINPPAEFSPMPFWFWNDSLDEKEIVRQIREMHEKGVDGFVIHPRIGIPREIPYMSDIFLGYVRCAVKEAHRLGMKVILYDEGMYPSGSAHGMVVEKNPEFATRGIRIEESLDEKARLEKGERTVCTLIAKKEGEGVLKEGSIAKYPGGDIAEGFVFLHLIEGFTYGHIRGIHIGEDDWQQPPRSADILNPGSVASFIELTHCKYYNALSEYFGDTVIGIFVDEPSVSGREGDSRMKPWTAGFADRLSKENFNITDLPALWYEVGSGSDKIRKRYSKIVEKQLEESFYKQIYDWCVQHRIKLVGHPALSGDIGLLDYFHVPGQDLIFRRVAPENGTALTGEDSTQAKCSSDAARHNNRRRNLNECFACGGRDGVEWAFNADDMKWTMDWLFVRGVNMLVPHAFFYSLDGPCRFGERPPDVGLNNIWWKHYGAISAYIKRMSYMLTDSVNVTSAAVLCESDFLPYESVKPLYENQIEFNYLEESLIENGRCSIEHGKIIIASQCYTTLIVENLALLSNKITEFARVGGRVIALNKENAALPDGVVSVPSAEDIPVLLEKDLCIAPPCRDLRVSHVVKGGEHFYILTNEGEQSIRGTVTVLADSEIAVLDPWNGTVTKYTNEVLALNRRESLIICAGKNPCTRKEIYFEDDFCREHEKIELTQWYIGSHKAALGSWTETENMRSYCGTVAYDTSFEISPCCGKRVILDLGHVGEQAEVYLNGEYVGCRLWAPYRIDLTNHLGCGINRLTVAVTNSLANKYSDKLQPSGLLGRVTLNII